MIGDARVAIDLVHVGEQPVQAGPRGWHIGRSRTEEPDMIPVIIISFILIIVFMIVGMAAWPTRNTH